MINNCRVTFYHDAGNVEAETNKEYIVDRLDEFKREDSWQGFEDNEGNMIIVNLNHVRSIEIKLLQDKND